MFPEETDRRSTLIHSIRPLLIFANKVCFLKLKELYPTVSDKVLSHISKRIAPECIRPAPVEGTEDKIIRSALSEIDDGTDLIQIMNINEMRHICDNVRVLAIHDYIQILEEKIKPEDVI